MIPILILAAGSSSRMRGTDKLLEPVAGEALLHRQVRIALETGAPVYVTLPPEAPARRAAIADLPAHVIKVPDAASGMAASFRRAIPALPPEASAVLLVLADLPELQSADLAAMLAMAHANPGQILRASSADGVAGHPVLFPRRFFADLERLAGDRGAQAILQAHAAEVTLVPLPRNRATTDLDTPEQWAAWRAASRDPEG